MIVCRMIWREITCAGNEVKPRSIVACEDCLKRHIGERVELRPLHDKTKGTAVGADDIYIVSRGKLMKIGKRGKDMRVEDGASDFARLCAVLIPAPLIGRAARYRHCTLRIGADRSDRIIE